MKTFEDLFEAYQSLNGYNWNMWQRFVPQKYNKLMYAYWNGGIIHPENVLKCILNGWFADMSDALENPPEDVSNWLANCKDDDDGTSDELFNAIIENHKAELQKIKEEDERKRELRRQRKFYKTARLLRTDISRLINVISQSEEDEEFKMRVANALTK